MRLPDSPLKIFLPLAGLALVAGGLFWWIYILPAAAPQVSVDTPTATSSAVSKVVTPTSTHRFIGTSTEGRAIEAYIFGNGQKKVVFVGGIHGGYEWNSVLLAYRAIDYFTNEVSVPEEVQVTIIPVLNPDGLAKAGVEGRFSAVEVKPNYETGLGRFNANNVDLNRNFDCKWQKESEWRGQPVSAGTAAFSESEARVLRDFVTSASPDVVVFWHSRANNVYASECENGVLPETLDVTHVYANAAGYGAVEKFDAYEVTGDAEGWLASLGIPAITVELETRDSIEWKRNMAGIQAILQYFKSTTGAVVE